MAGLFILIGVFQYFTMQHFLYNKKERAIHNLILSVPSDVWERWQEDRLEKSDHVPAMNSLLSSAQSIALIEYNGNVSEIYVDPHYSLPVPRLPLEEYRSIFESGSLSSGYKVIRDELDNVQMVICQRVGKSDEDQFIIQSIVDLTETRDYQKDMFLFYVIGSILALIVGKLTFSPVLRRTIIPLFRIVTTVERIHSNNLSERLPIKQGTVEVDRLAVAFNGMLERIETSFTAEKEAHKQMRRFIADASHELRTPLTSIHGFLEVLLEGGAEHPDQLRLALVSMYSESERLNKLVGDLLTLARMDRSLEVRLTRGRLGDLIRQLEPHLRMIAGARRIRVDLNEDPCMDFDPDKMKQVLLNLFQNAVQHTDPEKGVILIDLDGDEREIKLTIQDNGVGIKEIHIQHIFERFYRAEPSRARKYGGAGLGLAITKSIIEQHGGRIEVESREEKGALFRVCLPRGGG
ncbi:HAMP domain-containing protein [Paenibacillus sp. IB182493]|uniref:histidine kinase n=2 Tax=Paenibacillus arenilitoris TaxID=2772299 RepID=A0A927CQU3_9BACL|nr:HAMP domain-containing protein [Paenibacillus arenilitoris]